MSDPTLDAWRPGMDEDEATSWMAAAEDVMTDAWERGDPDVWGTLMTADVVISSQRSMNFGESGSWEDLLPAHQAALEVFPHCRFSDGSVRIISATVWVGRRLLTTFDDSGNEMAMWSIARIESGLISHLVLLDDHVAGSALDEEMDRLAAV